MSWKVKPLGDVCDILDSRRKPITKSDRVSGSYPYYGATGILDHVHEYLFDEALILLGEDGAKWGAMEQSAFSATGKYWVNNHAHVIRPHRDRLLDNWLIYYLNYSDLSPFISGLTVPKLNQGQMREIPIPVPPLPEQQRIVAKLDAAFAALAEAQANVERNLANARELFESYLNGVFEGKEWEMKRLEDICIIGDGNHSSNYPRKDELVEEGVPFIRATNMVNGRISGEDMRFLSHAKHAQLKKGHLKTGDVLITNRGEIGKTAIVDAAYDNANLNSQIAWLRCREGLKDKFLYFVLNSGRIQEHFHTSKSGTALQQFTIKQIKELELPVPSFAEQCALVEKFDILKARSQQLEANYQQKLAELEGLKKALLGAAFNGKL